MCFFKVKHSFGHISGMVGPIDVKRKGSASVRYWVQYVTLTFDLTHDLDLGCFKVKFRNSSISGIGGLIDVKWKHTGSEFIWYWADCMTLPFYHTHDLDPGVEISRLKSEIALSREWDSRLTWNKKDVSHPFIYPTLAREFKGFRVWGKFVFWTLELTDTPTNLANQVKVGHALDQSRSERAHQNNEPSWRSLRTDRRLSRQFWDDELTVFTFKVWDKNNLLWHQWVNNTMIFYI